MVKLTKEDENKLSQILKELNEVGEMLKGGEGSGVRGHKRLPTREELEAAYMNEPIEHRTPFEIWARDRKYKMKMTNQEFDAWKKQLNK